MMGQVIVLQRSQVAARRAQFKKAANCWLPFGCVHKSSHSVLRVIESSENRNRRGSRRLTLREIRFQVEKH